MKNPLFWHYEPLFQPKANNEGWFQMSISNAPNLPKVSKCFGTKVESIKVKRIQNNPVICYLIQRIHANLVFWPILVVFGLFLGHQVHSMVMKFGLQ